MCLVLLLALGNYLLKKKYFPLLKYKRLQKKEDTTKKKKEKCNKKIQIVVGKRVKTARYNNHINKENKQFERRLSETRLSFINDNKSSNVESFNLIRKPQKPPNMKLVMNPPTRIGQNPPKSKSGKK